MTITTGISTDFSTVVAKDHTNSKIHAFINFKDVVTWLEDGAQRRLDYAQDCVKHSTVWEVHQAEARLFYSLIGSLQDSAKSIIKEEIGWMAADFLVAIGTQSLIPTD